MKKALIVVGIIIVIIVGLVFFKSKPAIVNYSYSKEVAKILKPIYSDYDMEVEVSNDGILFKDSKYNHVAYNFYEGKIDFVDIRINLENNELDSEETIQYIEDLYRVVTDNFRIIKDYFVDDFLIREEYFINERDRQHLKDSLEFKEECYDWEARYQYSEGDKYTFINYSMDALYNQEGYDHFSIFIS